MNSSEKQDPLGQEGLVAEVSLDLAGKRLDKVLVELFPEYSRSRLQTWMKESRVLLNGQAVAKGNQKVKARDEITLSPGVLEHMHAAIPEAMDLQVAGSSEDYWVIDKPTGLVVHPAPGHWTGTLMNGLLHLDPELINVPRAGIVHRLDRDTTGLMVIARNQEAQNKFIQMLQSRIVKRVYLALVWGRVSGPLTVNKPIGRDPRSRLRMAVVDFGKPAVTHFRPIAHGKLHDIPVSLLICRLETGRTHQIRVHAQHAGFALVADPVYKLKGAGSHSALRESSIELPEDMSFNRQALHAAHLSFPDPFDFELREHFESRQAWDASLSRCEWPEFIAPLPADLSALCEAALIDLPVEALNAEILTEAKAHKATALVLPDAVVLDSEDDDDEDDDYDVEVEYVRDE